MTDRLPTVDAASACPFIAFDDERDERSSEPDPRHRCFADPQAAPRALAHQQAYCLSDAFPACPTFRDWAQREAARARIPSRPAVASAPAAAPDPTDISLASSSALSDAASRGAGRAPTSPIPTVPPTRSRDWAAPPPWLAGAKGKAGKAPEQDVATERFGAGPEEPDDAGWPGDERSADDGRQDPAEEAPAVRPDRAAGGAGAAGAAGKRAASTDVGRPSVPASSSATSGSARPTANLVFDDVGDEEGEFDEARRRRGPGGSGKRAADRQAPRTVVGPAWEEPHHFEPYPGLGTGRRGPAVSRLVLAVVGLAVAALVLFFVPSMLLRSGGSESGAASPTASPAASASAAPTSTPAPSASEVAASEAPSEAPSESPAEPSPATTVHTVKRGDTMSGIANKYGVTIDEILAANPDIKDKNVVRVGQKIVIPIPTASAVTDGASASP